ncbi:hypothetical protein N656DRAFT_479024 [Canariomyces notabilis]|uniref:Uncharacterized protein n=1 Tax=Canariomyces notabilis TaxID=2074819 RepID=A0AAN6YV97_9PEZI|nr:hypothetical protein N656DRAFT_479024 [Canariomyces arenarius]
MPIMSTTVPRHRWLYCEDPKAGKRCARRHTQVQKLPSIAASVMVLKGRAEKRVWINTTRRSAGQDATPWQISDVGLEPLEFTPQTRRISSGSAVCPQTGTVPYLLIGHLYLGRRVRLNLFRLDKYSGLLRRDVHVGLDSGCWPGLGWDGTGGKGKGA